MNTYSKFMDTEYLASLNSLAEYLGPPNEFWADLAEVILQQINARAIWLAWRPATGSSTKWKVLAEVPAGGIGLIDDILSPAVLNTLRSNGVAIATDNIGKTYVLAEFLTADRGQQIIMMAEIPQAISTEASLQRLTGFICIPQIFNVSRQAKSGARDATRLAQALESMGRILDSSSFDQASLCFVNDLSEHFACETVSLSWRSLEGLRLRAMSHSEKVDRRSEATSLLEEAGQEALTQGKEVMLPATEQKQVSGAHERYIGMVKSGHILTLPLIYSDETGSDLDLGAVTLERQRSPFTTAEQWALRLYCEMAIAPLRWHELNTKWLLVRLYRELGRSMPRVLKPRTGSGKILLAMMIVVVLGGMFVPVPFRLSATAVLKTDATAYVGAAYDGFIESSNIIIGASVEKGDPIFALNIAELTLERNALIAELAQSIRDSEIRRSLNQLSEMQVSLSKADELRSKLLKIDQKLSSATARAPISGVVVEGEPAKKIGEAVRRGESQITIAALSSLYVEAAVSEKDLSFVQKGQKVQLTLLARPKDTFPMSIVRVVPAPKVQDADNVFPVRMTDPEEIADWWLPGMTGVIKISAGNRPLWWIGSRRFLDYLRLLLWF